MPYQSKFHVGIDLTDKKKKEDDEKARIAANILKYIQQFGWGEQGGGAEQQFGTKAMYDFYKHMFGTEPPQQTTTSPEGQVKTQRTWPQATTEEMITKGARTELSKPGAPEAVARGQLGMGSPWEQMQAKVTRDYRIADLAKGAITSGLNVVTPQGTTRPLTGPEAIVYFTDLLDGKTNTLPIAPPTNETSKISWMMQLTQVLNEQGLYNRDYNSLSPEQQNTVNMAQTLGVAKVSDGMVQAAGTEVTGEQWKEVEEPLPGDMIQKHKEYTKGPMKGKREKIGVPYARRAPKEAGKLTIEDYGKYDMQVRDDARSMAIRELVARGDMKMVANPEGGMSPQFAIPADQGDRLLRASYAKHYRDAIRGLKSQGMLPPDWNEDPYGQMVPYEEVTNKPGEEDVSWLEKERTRLGGKSEGKKIGRFQLNTR